MRDSRFDLEFGRRRTKDVTIGVGIVVVLVLLELQSHQLGLFRGSWLS